jgi:hypothetical protein
MLFFKSFPELEYLDLAYGSQLAGCLRLAKKGPTPSVGGFVWGESYSLSSEPGPDTGSRADAFDAADHKKG